MKLTKETFMNGMQLLVDSYPNWKFKYDDPQAMATWYKFFKYMDDERFEHMINEYINSQKFNPTIAGLKECDTLPRKSITQLKHEQEMKEYEEQLRKEREYVRT